MSDDVLAEEVPQADQQAPPPPGGKAKERKVYHQIQLPSQEQMMWDEFMNNCATRTVMSGVMGMGLGVVFGIVMGSMDSAVTPLPTPP
jgi:import inner membrane translocase subunit TIM22